MTNTRPHRILIVDDEPQVCQLIGRHLKREGYEYSSAHSGEEAIGILEKRHFDLVITDIMMPGMSGVDLLTIVRRLYPRMGVIVVTAVDDKDTGLMAMELGAVGYIIKPFKTNEILISVSRALAQVAGKNSIRAYPSSQPDETGSDHLPTRKRFGVSATELLNCVKSGMSDLELMEKFNLSSEGLLDLLSQMGSCGKIDQKELDERASLAPQTVAVDIDQPYHEELEKPVIGVGEAVECIRSGMDDLALMKRFGISAKGLSSLFKKLVAAGFVTPEEFYGRPRSDREFVLDMRDMHRRYLAVSTPIWAADKPETKGWLLNVTERGLGTVGLRATVGDEELLVIDSQGLSKTGNITARAKCIWTASQDSDGQPTAGFQIIHITRDDLADLRDLVKRLTLAE